LADFYADLVTCFKIVNGLATLQSEHFLVLIVIPWDDLRKIFPGCRQVTNVLNGAETLPKISIS